MTASFSRAISCGWRGSLIASGSSPTFTGFHGFGLATKLQDFSLSSDGLIVNLLSFNVGVEIGQILALAAILIVMGYWRRTRSFSAHAFTANVLLMTAGFVLTGYQLAGYALEGAAS